MKIIGDVKHANKFCVETDDKGIQWVPSLDVAKEYVSDPKIKDWYNKTIIATYEQVVRADDGKFYLRSQAPKKSVQKEIMDNLTLFKQQSRKKIKITLEEFAASKGFESFSELISFSNSGLKEYKAMAKEAIAYRDKLYKYTDGFFSRFDSEQLNDINDIASVYDEYLTNFPFM